MTKLTIILGDITLLAVDAIVNAANHTLLGGGGVDGAIHRAAGPQLREECRALGGCETGQAKATKGYDLPAKFVIHTVGPVYGEESGHEAGLLSACYRNSLELAHSLGVRSIAFPAISTGVYGYPRLQAAEIAVSTINDYLTDHPTHFSEIIFSVYSDEDRRIYSQLLEKLPARQID